MTPDERFFLLAAFTISVFNTVLLMFHVIVTAPKRTRP